MFYLYLQENVQLAIMPSDFLYYGISYYSLKLIYNLMTLHEDTLCFIRLCDGH